MQTIAAPSAACCGSAFISGGSDEHVDKNVSAIETTEGAQYGDLFAHAAREFTREAVKQNGESFDHAARGFRPKAVMQN